MATIDVTESPYNAAGDGVTDDTDAINSALDDASPGDTVLIPATSDAYIVSSDNRAAVEMDRCGDDVTITGETNDTGDGTDSVLKMDDLDLSDGRNRWVAGFDADNVSSPLTGVTVQKLRFNGNKAANETGEFQVGGFNFYEESSGWDVTIADCIFEEAAGIGLSLGSSKITLERITSRRNTRHGIDAKSTGAGSERSPDVTANSIKVEATGNGSNGVSIDFHGGYHEFSDVYCNACTQGMKAGDTGGEVDYLLLKNANMRNAQVNSGWRYTGSDGSLSGVKIRFENVQFIDPYLDGMNLVDDAYYDFTEVLVDGANQANDAKEWGVRFEDGCSASIDTLRVQNTTGEVGLFNGSAGNIEITDYYHADNDGGAVNDYSGTLSIANQYNERSGELDVPGPDDVGAFSDSSDDGSSDSSSVTAVPLRSSGSAIRSQDGVLTATTGDSSGSVAVVDSFESGSLDPGWNGSTDRYTVLDASDIGVDAVDGAYVLECDDDNGTGYLYSTSGLANYFSKGAVGRMYVRWDAPPDGNSEFRGLFGLSDSSNYYEATLSGGDGAFHLRENDDGNYGTRESDTDISVVADQWYEIEITWDDGSLGGSDNDITLALNEYDPADGSTTSVTTLPTYNDSTHATADGIGLRGYSNGDSPVHIDFCHVE